MAMEQEMLRYTFARLQETRGAELSLLKAEVPVITEIPRIRFSEAKELVSRVYKRAFSEKLDFEPEEEKLLCEYVKKTTGSDFVFVTHYPSAKRPFYAMDSRENPAVTESFDLLFRGLEVTTGGQRIHSGASLDSSQTLPHACRGFRSFPPAPGNCGCAGRRSWAGAVYGTASRI